MKTLKYFFLLILIVIIGGAIYIGTLDNSYEVSRTKIINAPIEVVFNNVNDYKNWPEWSPWIEKDTLTELSYSDITFGKDASYTWKSENKDIGEGSMTTISSEAFKSIDQRIQFIAPWESESDVYWTFNPVKEGTEVTWGMRGEMSFGEKAFMVFSGGMDKMVGPDYEKGLDKLDVVLQEDMKRFTVNVNGLTTHGGGYYIYKTGSCKIDEYLSTKNEMMPQIDMYVEKNKISTAGPAFSIYHKLDVENNAVIFSSAIPVVERVITDTESGLLVGMLKPFEAVKVTLQGDYKNIEEAWTEGIKYIKENNLEEDHSIPSIEAYPTNPVFVPNPADWITEIYIPVKHKQAS
jgi:effector-binding domain-containing protein/ribosome-associated toxin RatA of RatAB toxin-antitoxin module